LESTFSEEIFVGWNRTGEIVSDVEKRSVRYGSTHLYVGWRNCNVIAASLTLQSARTTGISSRGGDNSATDSARLQNSWRAIAGRRRRLKEKGFAIGFTWSVAPHDTSIDGSQHAVRHVTDGALYTSISLMLRYLLLSSSISAVVKPGECEHIED